MKIQVTLLLLPLFILLSCSSDDDNPQIEETSSFTLNNSVLATPYGYIFENFGFENREQTIFLQNGQIINQEWLGQGCDYTNELTHSVIFGEILSTQNGLVSGTYSLSNNTIEDIIVSYNLNVSNNCVTAGDFFDSESGQITSGILVVEKTNNIYNLSYTIETMDYGQITGSFEGELLVTQDLSQ